MSKQERAKELYRLIYKVDGKVSFAEWYAKGESLKDQLARKVEEEENKG